MEKRVMFSNKSGRASFLGRNGHFSAVGVDVSNSDEFVYLIPVTTKGKLASCEIDIPIVDIPNLIDTLQKIYNSFDV